MKRPSDAFIGTMVGLTIVLLAPSYYINSPEDILRWLVVFPGLGAIIGTGIARLRHQRA